MKIFWVSEIGPSLEQEKRLREFHGMNVEIVTEPEINVSFVDILKRNRQGLVYVYPSPTILPSVLQAISSGYRFGFVQGNDLVLVNDTFSKQVQACFG